MIQDLQKSSRHTRSNDGVKSSVEKEMPTMRLNPSLFPNNSSCTTEWGYHLFSSTSALGVVYDADYRSWGNKHNVCWLEEEKRSAATKIKA